jgi:hypothetical protein
MIRRLVAGLIVVGLAVGIWALWPREGPEPTATTLPNAVASTTTTVVATTSTTAVTTSSTGTENHVVETTEEAEAILRDLWFGWFEGIYNQDEDRIREVVGTEAMLDAAIAQFDVMEFEARPDANDLAFQSTDLLRADAQCLSVLTTLELSGSRTGSTTDVNILRWVDQHWVLVSTWQYENDLWAADCDAQLDSF